jgi:hypothetical protein
MMIVDVDPAAVGNAAEAAAVGAIGVTIAVSLLVGTVGGGGATATGKAEMGEGRCAAAGAAAGAAVGAAAGATAGVDVAGNGVAGVATAGMGDDVTACGIIGIAGS